MAGGGILQRVTPHHYNLWGEDDSFIGRVHRFGDVDPLSGQAVGEWYGVHSTTGLSTGTHHSRHDAARDLIEHHEELKKDLG